MAGVCRNRWLRSYRTFAIVGLIILLIQIYLGYKFFTIDISSQSDSVEKLRYQKSSSFIEYGENGGVSARKGRDSLGADDEDSPSDIGSVKKKQNVNKEVTKLVQNSKNKSSLRLEELDFVPRCEITTKEAISAIHRAKTQKCKQQIVNITCSIQSDQFYEKHLPNTCPNHNKVLKKPLGCFKDEKNLRLLSGYYANYKETNNPEHCVNMCLQGGFAFAGVQYS